MSHARSRVQRRGFTLVELLVVITVIGILVGLLIPTVGAVMRKAKNAAIATELNDLARAVEAYKAKHGDYFPDFSPQSGNTLEAHIRVAYPRANPAQIKAWFLNSAATAPNRPFDLDPAEALVFWLSLIKNNPRDPITGSGEPEILFAFDESRLIDKADGDGWKEYYPKYGEDAPYVYFDGRVISGVFAQAAYAYATTTYPDIKPNARPVVTDLGRVRPYRSNTLIDARDNNKTMPNDLPMNEMQWVKPGQFQIICAGLDSHFGVDDMTSSNLVYKRFPTPIHYQNGASPANDDDNLADFSQGSTFGDAVP